MSDALVYVEEQVEKFSLAEQIHLLNFLANRINSKTSILNKDYSSLINEIQEKKALSDELISSLKEAISSIKESLKD